jgi:hypothetical protein
MRVRLKVMVRVMVRLRVVLFVDVCEWYQFDLFPRDFSQREKFRRKDQTSTTNTRQETTRPLGSGLGSGLGFDQP